MSKQWRTFPAEFKREASALAEPRLPAISTPAIRGEDSALRRWAKRLQQDRDGVITYVSAQGRCTTWRRCWNCMPGG